MNGPDHYREAERLLKTAQSYADSGSGVSGAAEAARAQVHATLALVSATQAASIPSGKVLVDRCRIAESAHGRQCLKADGHTDAGGHDFGGE